MLKGLGSLGFLGSGIIQSITNSRVAKKGRELQRELSAEQQRTQKEIADRQMELQRRIADNNNRLQIALAEKNQQMQIELARESRELQKQLAAFSAQAQRETAMLGIERNFEVNNFPLYIRKEHYSNTKANELVQPVKIVFSPPAISGSTDPKNGFADSDVVMTSWLTSFLQENIPNTYYEYLGNAWRDQRFRAQSAYRSIFNEFYDEPFVIIDCDIVRNSFNFRLCFWAPGSETYNVQQLITDFKLDDLLYESVRQRTENWKDSVYTPLIESGRKDKELEAFFPTELFNNIYLNSEKELQKVVEMCRIKNYKLSMEDYDYCIKMVSQLNATTVGVLLDIYHMTVGNINRPVLLKNLYNSIIAFPNTVQFPMRDTIENWVIGEYLRFVDQIKYMQENDSDFLMSFGNNMATLVNCKIEIINALLKFGREKEAMELLGETWEDWCTMLGISREELDQCIRDQKMLNNVLYALQSDKDLSVAFNDIYKLYKANNRLGSNRLLADTANKYYTYIRTVPLLGNNHKGE